MAAPQELSYSRCEVLLRAGIVGRVAFWAEEEPHILPMNYSVVGEAITMRTDPDSLLGCHASGARVAFEIDYFDYEYHWGCSVVARGEIEVVTDLIELAHIRSAWEPRPWASGDRSLTLRLPWTTLTGRQLGAGWDPMRELPVRRTL
jgi:nitroimidazol reductase NimA-like FMN-containing flavoprotein (pyridoxamine 5'-phosphate oxidase superfamily)